MLIGNEQVQFWGAYIIQDRDHDKGLSLPLLSDNF